MRGKIELLGISGIVRLVKLLMNLGLDDVYKQLH